MPEAQHIVKSYSQDLQRLRDLITEMGGIVENQLALATQAIVEGDPAIASRAIEQDAKVDVLERKAEQLVITMLALRQPMAADLRCVIAALKITAALERIGDYAKNVAKRSIVLGELRLPFSLTAIAAMARLVQENLQLVIDAVGEDNVEKAIQVWRSDEAIDDLYATSRRAPISCSSPRTWNALATTQPTSPRTSTTPSQVRRWMRSDRRALALPMQWCSLAKPTLEPANVHNARSRSPHAARIGSRG